MSSTGRLFANHARFKAWEGPWRVEEDNTNPEILNDAMQTCFLGELVGEHSLKKLGNMLEERMNEMKNSVIDAKYLVSMIEECGICGVWRIISFRETNNNKAEAK